MDPLECPGELFVVFSWNFGGGQSGPQMCTVNVELRSEFENQPEEHASKLDLSVPATDERAIEVLPQPMNHGAQWAHNDRLRKKTLPLWMGCSPKPDDIEPGPVSSSEDCTSVPSSENNVVVSITWLLRCPMENWAPLPRFLHNTTSKDW